MQWKTISRYLAVISFLVVSALVMLAQSAGTFRGMTEDDTGASIPKAHVSLKNKSTGQVSSTEANDLGEFSFSGLAPGEYVLRADAPNFKGVDVPITIGKAPIQMQHVRLKVANVNQEITVSAEASDPIAMDGNINSVEVNHDLLKSLPVKDSNPVAAAAMFLDPAASGTEGAKIVVDGVESSDLDVPSSGVKSVAVNKNPYSAEFGRPGKGRIEVVTRPGSLNRVHHHLLMTYRNSSLDATNAFANEQAPMNKSLWESDINGPLFREKGSFYLGGEFLRDNQNAFVHAITPTSTFIQNVPTPERSLKLLGRMDYRLTQTQILSVRYNFSHDSRDNEGIGPFDLPTRGYNTEANSHELRVSETALLSVNFSNELRFAFKNRDRNSHPVSNDPAMIVPGAFSSGGAQFSQDQGDRVFEVQNLSTWIQGKHTFRFGATAKRHNLDLTDSSNFGGTFTFSDLASFEANRPFLFTVNQGNPALSFGQNEYSYFFQDEMRLREDLTVLVGLRHELQSNLGDHNNLAPRVGISYAPGRKDLVFRAGGGVFYDRQPWTMEQQELLYNPLQVRHVFIQNPTFPLLNTINNVPPSTYIISPSIRAPYLIQVSAGADKSFGHRHFLSVEYTELRGLKLFRLRDVNAPLPATGVRPDPRFVSVDQFESNGSSRSHSLAVTFRSAVGQKIEILSQYTYSRSYDDTSGMFSLPADNFNLSPEWGRSDFDRHHRLNFAGIFQLPHDFKFGTITSISSGIPFNITTGFDNNGDGIANDRPAGVGRNTGNGPMFSNVDFRLSKKFVLVQREHGSRYLEVRADAFNVLNQVNAKNYIGVLTSPLFGRANSAFPARQLQFSMKASF